MKCTNIASSSNKVGMKHERTGGFEFNLVEQEFLERLREHSELWARFQSILELTRNAEGPVKTADAVEEQLIEELRQLGHLTMNQWATQAEQRVSEEFKAADATVRSRKKTLTWWCVFGLVRVQDRVWRNTNQSYLRPLAEHLEAEATPETEAPVRKGVSLPEPPARLFGQPARTGAGPADRFGPDRKRPPPRAPGPTQEGGCGWLPDHADQIAHLRVLRANHQWLSLWN